MMSEFEELWKAAVRFRRVSWELKPLLSGVRAAFPDPPALAAALERLLQFLTTAEGRTDANLSTTYHFITATEEEWSGAPEPLHAILDDMSGTLQDSVYAPTIAKTFEATPEQLLERLRRATAGETRPGVPLTHTEAEMATRREVDIKSGSAGEARRTPPEQAATREIPGATPRVAPETLQARQERVRKTRRPTGPRRQTRTLGMTAGDVPVPDVEPTDVEEREDVLENE